MDKLSEVHQSFQVVYEMIHDRGVDPSRMLSAKGTLQDTLFESDELVGFQISSTMHLLYINNKGKIDKDTIQTFVRDTLSHVTTLILVVMYEDEGFFKRLLAYAFDGVDVQCFRMKELLFNISKHNMVPKHELITDSNEILHLMELHDVKRPELFPCILKSDPMAKYLNAKPGNLLKITRISRRSGEDVIYRYCIAG